MDIAALATGLSQGQLCNTASILVMKKVMDTSAEQSQDLLQLMSTIAPPASPAHLGNNIDISV
ncbi:YjfB family protein [Sporomusa aerivorans]|uniref:YjfB family protein n=1 Tax=Sporomusa aerivorans TaxID=204936 RepID=UPI00352B17EF